MADKPILFSGPMVRALLAGTKTQTRRTLNPQPPLDTRKTFRVADQDEDGVLWMSNEGTHCAARLRYAKGDRLYVREHWRTRARWDDVAPRDMPSDTPIEFVATATGDNYGRFRQGMHMPRWASRITLTVTDVRVERLQDITEADALAEGVEFAATLAPDVHRHFVAIGGGEVISGWDARDCYGSLWEHINGPGAWEANPWVAAFTFTVRMGNIDQLEA